MPRMMLSPTSTVGRWTAAVTTLALVAVFSIVTGITSAAPAVAAVGTLTLTGDGTTSTVLAGEDPTIGMAAGNAGADADIAYNTTFYAVLPAGATYLAGSSTPAAPAAGAAGEPTVTTVHVDPDDASTWYDVLVWSNVADLPAAGAVRIGFKLELDDARYPVGSAVDVQTFVLGSSDERMVPRVSVTDGGVTVTGDDSRASDDPSVRIAPVELKKSEPSVESELLRGLEDQQTVYTLTVRTAQAGGTDDVVVTDYLPAQLHYLGCEDVDVTGGCSAQVATQTVVDPAGLPGGVYTQVVWDLGDVPAGTTVKIRYRAAAGPDELAADGTFTGPSTRQDGNGIPATNHADLVGNYRGEVADGTDTAVKVDTQHTVQVLDVALHKETSASTFVVGGTAAFTLQVRVGQYVNASDLVITDVLPDGTCPFYEASTVRTGVTWPAECEGRVGAVQGGTMTSAVAHADGTFTLTFHLDDVAANDTATVGYDVFQRTEHADGSRTATGDSFRNTADLTAVSTLADTSLDPDARAVTNGSEATVGTGAPSLSKQVWLNPGRDKITGVSSCLDYDDPAWTSSQAPTVRLGDLLCFQVSVAAAPGVALRDATVRDFVPVGTEFVTGDVVHRSSSFAVEQVGSEPAWRLGDVDADGNRFMPAGSSVVIQVIARVVDVSPSTKHLLGNLAKLRSRDANGHVLSARSEVGFEVAAAPTVSLAKTVASDATGRGTDAEVREGQTASYELTVTHDGDPADGSDYPLDAVQLWDALPAGFTCDDLADASMDCVDGPSTSTAGRFVVRFDLTGTDLGPDGELTAGESVTVPYELVVPTPLSVSSVHRNDASVVGYSAETTDGTVGAPDLTFVTADSLADPDPGDVNAPAANDTATVHLPGASVAKQLLSTSITAPGNTAGQATIGESATFRYSVTVPAGTSVFRAVLSDQLQAGKLTDVTAVAGAMPAGADVDTDPSCAPSGSTLCLDPATGTLRFPDVWTNDTATAQVFTVELTGRLADVAGNTHGSTASDTARFTSRDSQAATTDVLRDSRTAGVGVVVAAPTLDKTPMDGTTPVDPLVAGAGETVTFRLQAGNGAGRPASHDTVVVDCLPTGMTLVPASLEPSVTAGVSSGGTCPAGRTTITWAVGSLAGGASASTTYQATVEPSAGAGVSYINTARLSGSTLDDGSNGTGGERTLSATSTGTVNVYLPAGTKTADVSAAVPGDPITWTLDATLPADANFYDLTVLDTVPAGLSPAVASPQLTCTSDDATWAARCSSATFDARPQADGTTKVAWLFGDVPASSEARTITVTYTSTVDPASARRAGDTVTNQATLGWFTTDATRTVTAETDVASQPNGATGPIGSATVTVEEPTVTVAKSVDDTTVQPSQVFTYAVRGTASATAPHDVPAYNVVLVDSVPTGIVPLTTGDVPAVNGDTVGGGTWDATARTITWNVPSIAAGATAQRTYRATLADSDSLTSAARVNSVRATRWESLPAAGRVEGPSAPATSAVTPQFPRVTTAKTQLDTNPVYVNDQVRFRVTLTNSGTATARTVSLRDVLPAGWEFVPGTATLQVLVSGTPAALADPTVSGQTLTWSQLGGANVNLAPGQLVRVEYRARPLPAAASATGSAVAHTNSAQAQDVTDLAGGDSYANGTGSYVGPAATSIARIHAANLRVQKSAGTWVAGSSTNTWTVTVTNNGPDPAVGVVVDDVLDALPNGVQVLSVAGAGWTCTSPASDLSVNARCTLVAPSLAANASSSFTVTAAVAADVPSGTTAANTATVTSRTFDADTSNNTARSTATVTTVADLGVVKTGPASVAAGDAIAWTLTVTNHGPSVSRGSAGNPIVLQDTLPAGVDVTDVFPTGATCDPVTGTSLRCERTTDLPVGASFTVQVTGTVDSALVTADGPLVNAAAVTAVTPQGGNTRPDTASVSTSIGHSESLTVGKQLVGDATPGTTATYRITVHNGGPSDARGVTVTDALPAGLTFTGEVASGDPWTCTGTTSITCELGTALDAGTSTTFTFDVTVAASLTGPIENTAVVGSDWSADQDEDTATTGPRVLADLGITKTHTPGGTLRAGESTTFTLTVTNHGPSDAPGPIVVTDHVPAGLPVDGPIDAGPGSCTLGPDGSDGSQPVTCTLPAGLDVNDTWSVQVPVTVAPDAPEATYTNHVDVAGPPTLDEGDDDHANTASDTVQVVRRADVAITKSASPATVVAGRDVTYTLDVRNSGPSVAAQTVVRDVLPAELAPVSATWADDPDACTVTGQSVVCVVGDLLPGASHAVELQVVATVRSGVADGTTVVNSAHVESTTTDVDGNGPSSDEDDATITTATAATLELDKTADTTSVLAGEEARFSLVVTNDGPSDVLGPVTITDTLPAGMTFVGAVTEGSPAWECSATGQVVTCTLGDGSAGLEARADAPTLRLSARVAPTLDAGTYTNDALATSPLTGDSDPDSADVQVGTTADLGITKTHTGAPVAGEPFTWTLTVTNHGPSDSRADAGHPLVVTDTLPAGVRYVAGAGGAGFTCAAGAPTVVAGESRETVRCERTSTLDAGDEATFEVPVLVDADVLGDVTNTSAVVNGLTDQPDPQSAPDTATDTVTVTGVADLGLVKELTTDPADVVAGRPVAWQVDVTNHGPSTSRADADHPITVVDTLPAGVQDATASGTGWACSTVDAVITCTRADDLAVGAAPPITVTATVRTGQLDPIINVATVTRGTTSQPTGNPQPDTDDVTATPSALAQLRLDKTIVRQPVAGAGATYRLKVTNLGPSDARDVVVTDDLPDGLTFEQVAGSSAGSTWTCKGLDIATCTLTGPLAPATAVWVDIDVHVDEGLTGEVENTASVTSSTPGTDPTDAQDTVKAGSDALASLRVDKSHTGSVRVGDDVTFDLVVSNDGPSMAREVALQDLVPATLPVTDVEPGDGWACVVGEPTADGTPVLCLLDDLGNGQTAPPVRITVTVTAQAYPSVTNAVLAASTTPSQSDPAGATAYDEDTLVVPPLVDLAVSKTVEGDRLTVGTEGTFVLTVTNTGPTEDPGPVVVTDQLPSGLTYARATGAECEADGQGVTCALDGLAVGASRTIRLAVVVTDAAFPSVVNTATVDSAAQDVDPDNNTDGVHVDVQRKPLASTGADTFTGLLLAFFLLIIGIGLAGAARRRLR